MNRKRAALLLSFVALIGVGCGSDADNDAGGQAQSVAVEAFDFYFEDEALIVEPGASVTVDFANNGENLHSFTVDDFDFEIEADGGESVSSTFTAPDAPGAYDFYCKYHPDEMQGTISIGGANDPVNNPDDVDETDDDDDDEDLEVEVEDDDNDV